MKKHLPKLLELLKRRKKIRTELVGLKKTSKAEGLDLLQEAITLPDTVLLPYNEILEILQLPRENYSYIHFNAYVKRGALKEAFPRDYYLIELGDCMEKLEDLCKADIKLPKI